MPEVLRAALSSLVICARNSGRLGHPSPSAPLLTRESAELYWDHLLYLVPETPILGLTLFLSCRSDIAVLCFLISSILNPLLHVLCLDFWLF